MLTNITDEELMALWISACNDDIANEFVKRGITDPRICKFCAKGPSPCELWKSISWKKDDLNT